MRRHAGHEAQLSTMAELLNEYGERYGFPRDAAHLIMHSQAVAPIDPSYRSDARCTTIAELVLSAPAATTEPSPARDATTGEYRVKYNRSVVRQGRRGGFRSLAYVDAGREFWADSIKFGEEIPEFGRTSRRSVAPCIFRSWIFEPHRCGAYLMIRSTANLPAVPHWPVFLIGQARRGVPHAVLAAPGSEIVNTLDRAIGIDDHELPSVPRVVTGRVIGCRRRRRSAAEMHAKQSVLMARKDEPRRLRTDATGFAPGGQVVDMLLASVRVSHDVVFARVLPAWSIGRRRRLIGQAEMQSVDAGTMAGDNGARSLFSDPVLPAPMGKVSDAFLAAIRIGHDKCTRHPAPAQRGIVPLWRRLMRFSDVHPLMVSKEAGQDFAHSNIAHATLLAPGAQAVDRFFSTVWVRDDIRFRARHPHVRLSAGAIGLRLRLLFGCLWWARLWRYFLAGMRFGIGDRRCAQLGARLGRVRPANVAVRGAPHVIPIAAVVGAVEIKPGLFALDQLREVVHGFQNHPVKGLFAVFIPGSLEHDTTVRAAPKGRSDGRSIGCEYCWTSRRRLFWMAGSGSGRSRPGVVSLACHALLSAGGRALGCYKHREGFLCVCNAVYQTLGRSAYATDAAF